MRRLYLLLSVILCSVGVMWAITTITTAMNNNGNSYYGFTAKLTDTFYSASGDEMADEVNLQTLSIYGRTADGSGSDFKVAIYQYSADATTGQFVALSDNSNAYQNCGNDNSVSMDFTFTDVTLNKSQQYQFLFVRADATADAISSFEGYKSAAVSISLRMFSNQSLPSGDGTYKNNTLNSWEKSFMPAVKFVLSNPGEGGESGGGDTPEEPEQPDIPSDATIVKIISGDNSNDQAKVKSIGFTVPTTDVNDNPFTSATLWNINIFTKTGDGATNSYLVLSTSTNIADKVAVSTNNPTPAGSFAEYTFENTSIEAGKTYYMLFASDAAGTTQVNQRVAISGINGSGQLVVDGNGTSHSNWIPYYIVNNVPVPVTFDFFNESVDDIQHWVRISNVRNSNYCLYADDKDALHSHMTEASESESFALIGDENSFTIYSKTKQTFFGSADANQNTPVLAKSTGTTYKLIAQAEDGVYVIAPTANENQSFNMHGGAGKDIKYYAASDGGSTWRIAELGGSLTIRGMVDGNILPINNKVGVISITANGSSSNVKFNLNGRTEPGELGTVTITVPKAKQWTIAEGQGYSGYDCSLTFNGETKEQIVLDELPQESEVITATFTANDKQNLFYTVGHGRPYRIPAIAKAKNGDLIAISDDRFCGSDIGYGRVDLVYKVSHDNGKTWSENDLMLAQGDGNNESNTCGYGDAAICADRTSDKVMVMAVSAPNGGTCWTAAQRGVITWGTLQDDGTWKWEVPVDIKDELMSLLPDERINYFVGSGKISQSRIVKKGDYYRVYVALWTTNGSAGDGLTNYVIYSDEFGKPGSWRLLGEKTVRPVPGGDEPKAEELPDGSVVVSGRKYSGRYYNIFTFADDTYESGSWSTAVASNSVQGGLSWGGNSTNGEIMVVKAMRRSDNTIVNIALQSAPAGNDRSLVSIWYKIITSADDYSSPTVFSQGWTKGMQVCDFSSAYSTMCIQADGRIAFFYEDGQSGVAYDMIYQPISLSQLEGLEDYEICSTITFDTDGGSDIAPITQAYNSEVTAPAVPTKTGYTFLGWEPKIPVTMPAIDMTVKAKWQINQYTITFNTDGGSDIAPITQDYNSEVTAPENPTKTGYTFAGWDKEIPTTMPAENMTIKALWTINQYTITFDTDGGSDIAPITQDYNSEVTAPENPTKTGYTFAGWDKEIPTTMPAEDVTIKAQWTINQYTISFDTDGGSTIAPITQDYNSEVTAPENPTKTGYTFAGWDKEIPTTMPAEDVTIKAQWQINQYTITFNTDGGSDIAPITQDYNSEVTAPENPTKTGYTFAGWDKEIPATMPAEDVTIKAQWTINSYRLTYMVDGEVYKEYILEYGAAITPEPAPEKTDWLFSGWKEEIPSTMPAEDVVITGSFDVYTSIHSVNGAGVENVEIYDVNGTKLAKAKKGLNIVNNKKIIVR